ncbi:MAG: YbgC/FadM family acyl-CoA thioesterase [Burkholderiaceae bacterium]
MNQTDFRCIERLRVRWSEVDMQKIVFNAHYLTYIDMAMAAYWRRLALPYESAMAQLGGDVFLKTTSVTYHGSAIYEDTLDVGLRRVKLGRSSMTFESGIWRSGQLLTEGQMVYVYADPETQSSQALPANLVQLINDYEAGENVTQLHLADWSALQAPAAAVRKAVFVEEQGIAVEDEWDAADAHCLHAVVENRLGQAIATGRLLPSEDGVSKIGRMAVLRAIRGGSFGRQVLNALCDAALARGDHTAKLSAQRSAEGFYERLGFRVVGEPFDEVGIPHVHMEKALSPS